LFGGDAQRGIAFTFGVALCSSPIVGALGVVFFAIGVGIVQLIKASTRKFSCKVMK